MNTKYNTSNTKRPDPKSNWDAPRVKALRDHMHLTQTAFAEELGTQQQTVSEWECGYHLPKGMSVKMLNLIAERTKFVYQTVREPTLDEVPTPPAAGEEKGEGA